MLHSLLLLAAGTLYFLGQLKLGSIVLRRTAGALPGVWHGIAGACTGVMVTGLVVQLLGMRGLAMRAPLAAMAVGLMLLGAAALPRAALALRPALHTFRARATPVAAALVAALALAMLVVALAPSTKHDEIYYHMFVAQRILSDGGLRYYLAPIEAAAPVSLFFQHASVPAHALGLGDLPNVVSWWLGIGLVALVGALAVAMPGGTRPFPVMLLVMAGLHMTVHYGTAGSHALGELALGSLLLLWLARSTTLRAADARAVLAAASVLAAAAVGSKLSHGAAALLLLLALTIACVRAAPARAMSQLIAAVVPAALLLLPVLAWTTVHAGGPLGPYGPALLPAPYDVDLAARLVENMRTFNQRIDLAEALFHHPLVWVLAGMLFAAPGWPVGARRVAAGVVLMQAVLIAVMLPWQARFMGGLHLAAAGAAAASPGVGTLLRARPRLWIAVFAMLLPWVAGAFVYSAQFLPPVIGTESRQAFLHRKTPMTVHFAALDTLLPPEAVLRGGDLNLRLPTAYAPRRFYFPTDSVLPGAQEFRLDIVSDSVLLGPVQGRVVYAARRTPIDAYRTPGRPPLVGYVRVTRPAAPGALSTD